VSQRCGGCNQPLRQPPYEKGLYPDTYFCDKDCYLAGLEEEYSRGSARIKELDKLLTGATGQIEEYRALVDRYAEMVDDYRKLLQTKNEMIETLISVSKTSQEIANRALDTRRL
jgi:hypothetical protein